MERGKSAGNVHLTVADRGPKRSAPWTLRDSAPTVCHGYLDRP